VRLLRVDRRMWWLTVSNAAGSSSKMSTEDLEVALASIRASICENRAVSAECLLLKPDWLLSRRLFCARKLKTWLKMTHQVFKQ